MDPMQASITLFAGNFAPRGWAFCDGQLLAIQQYQALFALIGTIYGGDGRTTFALPDLRGRAAIGEGLGPGLSDQPLGRRSGLERVVLTIPEIPSHSHTTDASSITAAMPASTSGGAATEPGPTAYPSSSAGIGAPIYGGTPNTTIGVTVGGGVTVHNTGGSQAHTNMQPYLAVNYIIAMVGIFPSRN